MTDKRILYLLWLATLGALLFKSVFLIGVVNYTEFFKAAWGDVWSVVPTYAVYLAFLIIPLALVFLVQGKKRLWGLLAGNVLVSVLFLFDLWHFRAFGTFLSVHVISQTANLTNLGSCIWSMGLPEDLWLFFDIPVGLLLVLLAHRQQQRQANCYQRLAAVLLVVAAGYLAYAHYVFDLSPQRGQKQYLFTLCWAPSQTVTGLSPLGYHVFDAYTYAADSRPLLLTTADKAEIAAWYQAKQERRPDNAYKGLFAGKNLLMIQVESLESFYLQHTVGGQEITPNLNRLLPHSLYFPDFYEQVSNGTTADAEFMANTSLYPLRRGTAYFRYPDNTYCSLPKLMAGAGYTTLALHPDNKSYWNWQYNMESIGYQLCLDAGNFMADEQIGLGLSDGSFFRQAAPLLKEQRQPFLAFMLTLTNHTTFELPDKYQELEPDVKFAGTMLGKSFHTVHYTDKQLGWLLQYLDNAQLLDNTVVVIYGDHTGVHKFYAQETGAITPAEAWWQDNQRKVPLIIYQKNLTGREIAVTGGQIDILPTVAYLLGIDEAAYAHSAMGRNLLNTGKDFAVLADSQVVGQMPDSEQEQAVKGWELADKIICSSYFGKR